MLTGILLAGGSGKRLFPLTSFTNKHLLNIYNKPMIFYSLSILLLLGIRKIIVVTNKNDKKKFYKIFNNFKYMGISFNFCSQNRPKGILDGLKIAIKQLNKDDDVFLILGDNIFYGETFPKNITIKNNSKVFLYRITNPKDYGVAKIKNEKLISIVEKPKNYISDLAVTGLYFYKSKDFKFINKTIYSKRGELEITDFNNLILKKSNLDYQILGRGSYWIDAGTFSGFLNASNYVNSIQDRTNLEIACIEEICLIKKFVSKKKLHKIVSKYPDSNYKNYLLKKILI
jgi:glucose-1-phosphate thymidylyltransferase